MCGMGPSCESHPLTLQQRCGAELGTGQEKKSSRRQQQGCRHSLYEWSACQRLPFISRASDYVLLAAIVSCASSPQDADVTPVRLTLSLGNARSGKEEQPYRYRFVQPPAAVDWRAQGIVGPVKNQHVNGSKCGCCWAFATIGVVECINAIATGQVVSLSEQQLLDCDHAGEHACQPQLMWQ